MNKQILRFHDIYQTYSSDVYTFAFWLVGNKEDAEDITSETFIRAWTAKSDLRYSSLKAYLLKITRNLFLQKKRNTKPFISIEDVLYHSIAPTEYQLELNQVLNEVNQLSEPTRSIFLMKTYEGLTYTEIAEIYEMTVSACKVSVFRARKTILERIK